jgi:hypothetical protein
MTAKICLLLRVSEPSTLEQMDGGDESGGDNPFDGSNLVNALARWAAEAQVDEAAQARTRERWLQQQAAEETTFVSVLTDLGERQRSVLVHTSVGHRHVGSARALGVDFVVLRTDVGRDVLIATTAITAVRSQPRDPVAHSGRVVALHLHFADAILAMGAECPRVTVTTSDGASFNGDLVSVGRDVITVRVDGDERANVYIPMGSVTEIAVALH